MTRLVLGILLYSCTFAFVTGIVIVAANFLIQRRRERRTRARRLGASSLWRGTSVDPAPPRGLSTGFCQRNARCTRSFSRGCAGTLLQCTSAHVQVFGRRQRRSDDTLRQPASEKRQGTKSRREVVDERCRRDWCGRSAMGIWARRRFRRSVAPPCRRVPCTSRSPAPPSGTTNWRRWPL